MEVKNLTERETPLLRRVVTCLMGVKLRVSVTADQ